MSVRFDASGDYLRRTTNLPGNTAYTICGWARLVTDTNTYSTIVSIENATVSSGAYSLLSTDSDGVSLKQWAPIGASATLATLTTGTDFFWAIACGAAGAGGVTAYYRAKGSTSLTSVTGYGDTFTPAVIYLGNDSYTEPWNGRIWNVKVWNRVLTSAELMVESHYRRVKFPTSRNAHWEMRSSSDTIDRSGLGYSLTVGGTLGTETEGVKLWVPKTNVGRVVSAGGVTGTLSVTVQNDTVSATGTTTVVGSLARTLTGDTSSSTGTTTVLGTLAKTLADDTVVASGDVGSPVSGDLASTLANDTVSATGTTIVLGTLTKTLIDDASAALGTTIILGTLSLTLSNDTVSASGSVGSAVSGSASPSLGSDTSSSNGTTTIVGTLSKTNSDDTSTANGTTTILGSLAVTIRNDTASASGVVGTPTPGSSYLPLTGVGR